MNSLLQKRKFIFENYLNDKFDILSTNFALECKEFVSTIEGKDGLPIYGTQWHPSFPIFLFNHNLKCLTHTKDAVLAMQYIANFFVSEARKNDNQFTEAEIKAFSFDNRMPTFTEIIPGAFHNLTYFFGPPVLMPTM